VKESQLAVPPASTAAWLFLRGTDTVAVPLQLPPLPSEPVKAMR